MATSSQKSGKIKWQIDQLEKQYKHQAITELPNEKQFSQEFVKEDKGKMEDG